jgi:hypothetical protein
MKYSVATDYNNLNSGKGFKKGSTTVNVDGSPDLSLSLLWTTNLESGDNYILATDSFTANHTNSTSSAIPVFYTMERSAVGIISASNGLPNSPRNFTTSGSGLNFIASNNYFILDPNNPLPNIVTTGSSLILDAKQISSYPTTASTWYDLSGYGNTGTLVNGPTWDSNGVIMFDGVDDYVTISDSTSLDITGSISMEILFKTPRESITERLITKELSGGTFGLGYQLSRFSTNRMLATYNNGNTRIFLYSNFKASDFFSNYTHVIYTYNGSNSQKMWINGVDESGQNQFISNFTAGSTAGVDLNLMRRGGEEAQGTIAYTRLYNKGLSQQEILQNYYQAPIVTDGLIFAVDAGNLVSYENGSTTTYSLTGSFTGSLENGVGYLPDNGGVFNFDGVNDIIRSQNVNPSEITIEVWKKWIIVSDDWLITNQVIPRTDVSNGYLMRIDSPSYNFTVYFGIGPSARSIIYNPIVLGEWTHVLATYDPVTEGAKLYWNGQLVGTDTGTGAIDYTGVQGLTIGAAHDLSVPTPGPVGPVRIYDRALTVEEVSQNFNAQRSRFGV